MVKANVPGTGVLPTTAEPPLRVDDASVWPTVIEVAVGQVTVGVALLTCTLTVVVAVV